MTEIFGGLPSWRLFYLLRTSCCRSPKLPAGYPVLAVVTDADAFAGAEETGGGCIQEAISRSIQACCSRVNIGGSSDMVEIANRRATGSCLPLTFSTRLTSAHAHRLDKCAHPHSIASLAAPILPH